CNSQKSQHMADHTNALINSTSPYLLQHAHNPVNWEEWTPQVLEKAKEEDKPILVSIGYSSCHWCHVMEKESFEDTSVARLMNENFINIKVDREERPDVDQIYMDAVQSMGLNGGWPLNVFLTPDQKPFYGGTYFPNKGWKNLLSNITDAFQNKRDQIDESAEKFTESLRLKESEKYKLEGDDHQLTTEDVDEIYQKLSRKFDSVDGGIKKSPKFPMPSVWQLLATYYFQSKNQEGLDHLLFTLEKIANGGIYDHVGGGFARYSTDGEWHVPHFEKMLYDNGQLLSLYANGYKLSQNPQFKEVILETADWLTREMMDPSGGFYSALDADSEGEEGKFYVWSSEEIQQVAGANYEPIAAYYDVRKSGNWEGKNVLRVMTSQEKIQKKFDLTAEELVAVVKEFKTKALIEREKRVRPGLDSKIIAGWNGLTLSGLSEAYQALNEPLLLEMVQKNAAFIKSELVKNGKLKRFPDKEMEGFLEDYAAVIKGFINYYETTFDWEYLELAQQLMKRAGDAFYDETEKLYFFTSDQSQNLIVRKKELFDNVIPSSNSMMAWNLIHLGTHFYDESLISRGKSMLAQVRDLIKEEPEYMSNWGTLALELTTPFAEIVVIGDEFKSYGMEINRLYLPNKILTGSSSERYAPLFENKGVINDKTTVYVCYDKSCKRPVNNTKDAIVQLSLK
ncbi:MAG: thioredoxin domain-containing protein, partial [Bacteroidota bacterium]